jgi:hypothetical protein
MSDAAQEEYYCLVIALAHVAHHGSEDDRTLAGIWEADFLNRHPDAHSTFSAIRPEWIERAVTDEVQPLFMEDQRKE